MKVYKDGAKVNADKAQWPALKAAGWSRSPDVTEKEESETSSKKVAPKTKRKPIAKKSNSEE